MLPATMARDAGPASLEGRLTIAEFEPLESTQADWSARDGDVVESVCGDAEIKPLLQVQP
jgi:hypothetical protein